jgi:hypothetical protein
MVQASSQKCPVRLLKPDKKSGFEWFLTKWPQKPFENRISSVPKMIIQKPDGPLFGGSLYIKISFYFI